MAEIGEDVAVLKDWRVKVVDPGLRDHGDRLMSIEENQNEWKGSLKVIMWMNGVILSLVIVLLGTFLAWGLSHVTLRVDNSQGVSSMHQSQDSQIANTR